MRLRLIKVLALSILAGSPGLPLRAGENMPVRLAKVRIAADGSGFVRDGRPFMPIGLTYFRPHTGWAPQVWKRFDPEATRADFRRLKAMGVTVVRVFLTYGSFLQSRGQLDSEGLAKLDRFLDIAEEAGIYVHPTGPDHWEGTPGWARGDRYAEEDLLKAQESFWTALAARYRGRGVIWAYDLLNEPEIRWEGEAMRARWNRWLEATYKTPQAVAAAWGVPVNAIQLGILPVPARTSPAGPLLRDYQHCRESIATEWTRRQAAAIRAADPDALVTVGLIQSSVPLNLAGPWHYAAFRPRQIAPWLDFLEVHFYPLDGGVYHYENAAAEQRNLAYLHAVVREAAAPGKPVVLAEFGWYGGGKPTLDGGTWPAATELDQARWCRLAVETTRGLAAGWLNWGLYDYPGAGDITQLSGLLTADGKTKAWGTAFSALATELHAHPPRLNVPTGALLDWDACTIDAQARAAAREQAIKAFQDHLAAPRP